jgi:hypothetical protein
MHGDYPDTVILDRRAFNRILFSYEDEISINLSNVRIFNGHMIG